MPFISKTYNVNFIELATRSSPEKFAPRWVRSEQILPPLGVMVGMPVRSAVIQPMDIDFVACKAPMPRGWSEGLGSDVFRVL